MKRIGDVCPGVGRKISRSDHFAHMHALKRGKELVTGIVTTCLLFQIFVKDQRKIAGKKMSFDSCIIADVSGSCLELTLHDAEVFFDLPSMMIDFGDLVWIVIQIGR